MLVQPRRLHQCGAADTYALLDGVPGRRMDRTGELIRLMTDYAFEVGQPIPNAVGWMSGFAKKKPASPRTNVRSWKSSRLNVDLAFG